MDSSDYEMNIHIRWMIRRDMPEVLNIEQNAASIRYVRAIERLKTILDRLPEFRDTQ